MELSPGGTPIDKKPVLTADGKIVNETETIPGEKTESASSSAAATYLTVDQVNIQILPVIYDIIRIIEKDPVDNTSKQRESQECAQKILELQKRFDSARDQIKQLRGIDYNKEEQLQNLEILRNQMKLKRDLLIKYKGLEF